MIGGGVYPCIIVKRGRIWDGGVAPSCQDNYEARGTQSKDSACNKPLRQID